MRYLLIFMLSLVFLISCRSRKNEKGISGTTPDTVLADARPLKPVSSTTEENVSTSSRISTHDQPKDNGDSLPFTGRHNFTLQWIGWNIPGLVIISRDTAGWFHIRGQQQSKDGYVKIDGLIKPLTVVELRFKGEIRSKVSFINNGEECLRNGQYWFISTKGRKYWRLQQMINCEGGRVTDYIDIYF